MIRVCTESGDPSRLLTASVVKKERKGIIKLLFFIDLFTLYVKAVCYHSDVQ